MSDDEQTSAVLGTTTTVKTMVDGTLRISLDIEPRHAQAAFALFGAPGTPVAVARIMPEIAQQQARQEMIAQDKPKGGALCKLAGMFCGDGKFRDWLRLTYDPLPRTAEDAATIIRNVCGVGSRADLDHNEVAANIFHQRFRLPYSAWLDGRKT
jgi:hypothetical protein